MCVVGDHSEVSHEPWNGEERMTSELSNEVCRNWIKVNLSSSQAVCQQEGP